MPEAQQLVSVQRSTKLMGDRQGRGRGTGEGQRTGSMLFSLVGFAPTTGSGLLPPLSHEIEKRI